MEDSRPLSAKEKRQEQIKRWENSATDLECETYTNPNIRVKFDDGAVFLAACSSGDLDEVKKLLKKGADINFANVDGLTALHQACIDGNLDVVKFLVENGSEIDQEDNEGWTPLHATASCGFMDIAKYLVESGANVGAVNSEAELPIDIAEDEMIDFLQNEINRQGIDIEAARDIERQVMLQDANDVLNTYHSGDNVEVYRHAKSGATALHIAAAKGYNDVLKILIKAGIDVNVRDNDGWTPLHAASHWSQEDSAKILADKNADFRARSKLGQTPFDVADEDMLEYLTERETEQKNNKPNQKESEVIEPPPVKTERLISSKEPPDIIQVNEIQNGRSRESKKLEESSSSSEEEVEDTHPIDVTSSPRPSEGRLPFSREKTRNSSLINDHSKISNDKPKEETDISYGEKPNNRPASLRLASQEPQHRPVTIANNEANVTRPVAATQPVQSVTRTTKENGTKTTNYGRDAKEDSPSTWRTGLKKTGSFGDKPRPNIESLQSKTETERSSYSSRFNEESKTENTRLARVAPILDARKTKIENESEETPSEEVSGYQRGSYGSRYGKYAADVTPATTTTDNDASVFKRSSITETTNDTTSQNDTASSSSDKRRSHLQPVRDEEAEAQRRARSRRERQSRRSTQGVTLDVVEEAMRTIGMITNRKGKPTTEDGATDLSRGDSSNQGSSTASSQSASAGTPVTALPSGYIPSDQRVKANDVSTDSKSSSIPSIKVEVTTPEGENDKGDSPTSADADSNSAANRGKSAAQQRRRNRKERRSTGIPDVKPASSTAENNEPEEEESSPKEDAVDSKAERLRATTEKYSSLPERSSRHRTTVRSDSDIPSRLAQPPEPDENSSYTSSRNRTTDTKNYKKLYEENQVENERLRGELTEAQRKISELQARLDKADDNSVRRQALDNEKRERRALERKLAEMEQESQDAESRDQLRVKNELLAAENTALLRIVEKLGGTPPVAAAAVREVARTTDKVDSKPAGLGMRNKKPGSAPDLLKLEQESEAKDITDEPDSPRSVSRSSSSSSLSLGEDQDARRSSSSSLQGTEAFTRTSSLSRDRPESPSSLSSSSTASLRRKARLEASSSSPSLYTRSYSPRRLGGITYSTASDYGRGSTNYSTVSDYVRPSTYTPSRYKSKKDSSSLSNTGSYTIPISSSRKEFLRTLPPSSSVVSKSSGTSRTTPTSLASSYSSPSSRTRTGYSSAGRSALSKPTSLSKYSSLSSSRRPLKY